MERPADQLAIQFAGCGAWRQSPHANSRADALHLRALWQQARFSLRYALAMLSETLPTIGSVDMAVALHRKGLRLVPLVGKRAFLKDWQHLHLGEADIRDWSRRKINWGAITGDPIIVLDTDTDEAERYIADKDIDSPVVVQSGGGGKHRWFVRPDGVEIHSSTAMHKIRGLDLKGWNSYIVLPGSTHPNGNRYAFLPGSEFTELHALPVFDPQWAKEERPPLPAIKRGEKRISRHINNVRAYVRGIPSVQGQGGDKAAFTVACLLVEAGYSPAETLAEMEAWNATCAFPPWSTKALEHKVRRAFMRVCGVDPQQRR